jgi:hypothetical protein
MEEPTFVCKDCGTAVYDALGDVRERCYPCQWVANIPDDAERTKIREWLIEVGAIDENADRDGAGAAGVRP